jgi:hypothetical protein
LPECLCAGHTPTYAAWRASALEARRVAQFGNDHRRGGVADAANAGYELTDLVLLERSHDFSVQAFKPCAQGLEILAGIAHAELVAGTMLTADRDCRRLDQLLRQLRTYLMVAVVAESRQALTRNSAKSSRGRILPQDRGGEFGAEILEIARELGKTQVYQAMQLIEARD